MNQPAVVNETANEVQEKLERTESFAVASGFANERADLVLADLLGISRTKTAELCKQGRVISRGRRVAKSDILQAGDVLEVTWVPRDPLAIIPCTIEDLQILHDDDDLLVLMKPENVVVHPAPSWRGDTVLGALKGAGYDIATSGAAERQGVVHRLDRGTSGVMVVAKSEHAYAALKHQFKNREVLKIYHTVVHGMPDPFSGTIEGAIGRDSGNAWRFTVTHDGKPAITHYELLEAFRYASLLEVKLETGRTHQIRVHMSERGHPCVGDMMYGADPRLANSLGLRRQWLHAKKLGFTHPVSNKWMEFESEYPPELRHALEILESGRDLV